MKLESEGLQRTEIARLTGIGVASVYRQLADAKRMAGSAVAENSRDAIVPPPRSGTGGLN
jgi:hypothetical protein